MANPMDAAVLSNKFDVGDGLERLAEKMKIGNVENLAKLSSQFKPIEFDQLLEKSAEYDYCAAIQMNFYDYCGFGEHLTGRLLSRTNFRRYTWLRLLFQAYLSLIIVQIVSFQTLLPLRTSGYIRVVEAHVTPVTVLT